MKVKLSRFLYNRKSGTKRYFVRGEKHTSCYFSQVLSLEATTFLIISDFSVPGGYQFIDFYI